MAQALVIFGVQTFARLALAPKKSKPKLTDIQIQRSEYGIAIPRVYGGIRIAGNVIWSTNIIEHVFTNWLGDTVVGRALSLAVGICAGPKYSVLRMWADGKIIYDVTGQNTSAWMKEGVDFRFYPGDEVQEPDPYIEGAEGVGEVPAYRGLCYVVFQEYFLSPDNPQVPNFEFQIADTATGVVPYDELTSVDADENDRDHVVFSADNQFFVISSGHSWYRIDTRTDDIVVQRTILDPETPHLTGGFDIDERDIIHTCKEGTGGHVYLCRLDADTFAEIAADTVLVDHARIVRVFRTSVHPYVVAVLIGSGSTGDTLYVANRDDYGDVISIAKSTLYTESAPLDTEWVGLDIDEAGGVVYGLGCGEWLSNYTKISKITLLGNGARTQQTWDVTSYIQKGDNIMFDADTDQVVVASTTQGKLCFFSAADMAYLGYALFQSGTDFCLWSAFRRGTVDGLIYFALRDLDSGAITGYSVDVATRQVYHLCDLDDSGLCLDDPGAGGGSAYDSLTHALVVACGTDPVTDYVKMFLGRGTSPSLQLSEIVEDICEQAGLGDSGDTDASELIDTVYGYAITERMSARDALEPLMTAFFFDAVDTGGTLKFVRRGNATIETLTADDLGASLGGEESTERLVSTRRQELELPRRVDVSYLDIDANYVVGTQSEQRLVTESRETLTLNLPLAMGKDGAKQIAVKTLAAAWAGRTGHTVKTHYGFLYLDPGDVITVTDGTATHTARIDRMEWGVGVVTLYLVNESSEAYVSDATGTELPGEADPPGVDDPGVTLLVLVDCPLVSSLHNVPGVYVATMGRAVSWAGANVIQSASGVFTGAESPLYVSHKDATVGKAVTALAGVSDPWVWDRGSSVNVRLLDSADTLSSATEAQVLAGANIAILGDEIVQWTTATAESDGSYTLSGLLRGRKGTDGSTGSHAAGEYFVPLDEDLIEFVQLPSGDIDIERWYRAQTQGSFLFSAQQSSTCAAKNMMPWSPQHVRGARDGTDNLTITWKRRTRIGGEWVDGGDVSLGETAEDYEADVLDGSAVVRTLHTTSQSVLYTAAQQVTDFGSAQASVDVTIYQISSVVGRGFGTSAAV